MNYIAQYTSSWIVFQAKIESLAKGRCVLTNKNWAKLKEIHLKTLLKQQDNPLAMLFHLRWENNQLKIPSLNKHYQYYKEIRDIEFANKLYEHYNRKKT